MMENTIILIGNGRMFEVFFNFLFTGFLFFSISILLGNIYTGCVAERRKATQTSKMKIIVDMSSTRWKDCSVNYFFPYQLQKVNSPNAHFPATDKLFYHCFAERREAYHCFASRRSALNVNTLLHIYSKY